jgi:hypothetical protein
MIKQAHQLRNSGRESELAIEKQHRNNISESFST